MGTYRRRNSTKSTEQCPRGLGLNRLLEFSKINHGLFRICNENILFEQNSFGNQNYQELGNRFLGSFFEMHIMEQPNVRYELEGE